MGSLWNSLPELFRDVLIHFAYWLDYWLLFNLVGVLLARLWLMPLSVATRPDLVPVWRRSLQKYLALYIFSTVAVFGLEIVEICSESIAFSTGQCTAAISTTYFADIWLFKFGTLAALLALTICASLRTPSASNLYATLLAIGALCFAYSAVSHAANWGLFTAAQLVYWLHFLATLVWAGSILGFYSQLQPLVGPEHMSRHEAIETVHRFSRVAGIACAVALISGFYTASQLTVEFASIGDSVYGQRLLVKVAVVIGMLTVAIRLRYYLIPQLSREQVPDQALMAKLSTFKTILSIDRLLVALVLLMTADITHQVPPIDAIYQP